MALLQQGFRATSSRGAEHMGAAPAAVSKMAFKPKGPSVVVPEGPQDLLKTLTRRKIPDLLQHQGDVLRRYVRDALNDPDVAIQLPTGSGKTLVGLMIAEWRRRKFGERVVYLCPTKQLVNQVVEQAAEQYGLAVTAFTGKKSEYSPADKTSYRQSERVAITNYSSLFNINPFFDRADLILIDDAHAAENYVAKMWSLSITRKDHAPLYGAFANILKPVLSSATYARLTNAPDSLSDATWVDKVPSPALAEVEPHLVQLLDSVTQGDVSFVWQLLRDQLKACHVYISPSEILVRPLVPPTWTHEPFTHAKQRIYMSATLGEGGDLERLTGRTPITRVPAPEGWDRQGIGRRFFIFPAFSLNEGEAAELRVDLMKLAGRSLVAVPSDKERSKIEEIVNSQLGFATFSAGDIEESKKPFIEQEQAVAIVANRYDGIDFPNDECRMLFVEGLPTATNLQERFLMSRMGANALFHERVQTRVLQAIGRCTRSLTDRSAVVIMGDELSDYLADKRLRVFFHPELQAELTFGVGQSREVTRTGIVEMVEAMLANTAEWEDEDQGILADRAQYSRAVRPEAAHLASAVSKEIQYQKRMWQADYAGAYQAALDVLEAINKNELRGYRALWQYLAGSAALLAAAEGDPNLAVKGRLNLQRCKESVGGTLPWLAALSRYQGDDASRPAPGEVSLAKQVERFEEKLLSLGVESDHKFNALEIRIREGLGASKATQFETGHRLLGELIGLHAGKVESEGSPDPWWAHDDRCIVFEDFQPEGADGGLTVTKARQAHTHPNWIKTNVKELAHAEILAVLLTSTGHMSAGCVPHVQDVGFWSLADFRSWAEAVMATVRELRRTLSQRGDLDWRARASASLEATGADFFGLYERLKATPVGGALPVK